MTTEYISVLYLFKQGIAHGGTVGIKPIHID
jgi:hypothetical protein